MSIHYEQLLSNADQLIKDNKIEEAVAVLERIIQEEPTFGKAHNHLGFIYETKIKDYAKAELHYKIAYQTSADYCAIYYNYAILLSNLKRFDELKVLLTKAETVVGINRSTINNEWAIMYEAEGNLDKAIEHYKLVASSTFDNKTLDIAISSVERCNRKKSFLNGTTTTSINPNSFGAPPGL
jgi:tetratricopeptide (TPR) repeat protein